MNHYQENKNDSILSYTLMGKLNLPHHLIYLNLYFSLRVCVIFLFAETFDI